MGSPSGTTSKVTTPVDGSDRKFYIRAAENGNKQALKDFDAALNKQQPVGGGTSSGSIRGAQDQLTALGFDTGGSDGVAGPKTAAAVRAFQAANGLTVDGVIGPQTRAALATANSNPPPAAPPGPPAAVDGSDRKFYIQADNPAALEKFDQDLQAYNDFKTLQTPVDGSDRKFYAQADDPKVVDQFDRDLASYNRVQASVADAYQSQVDRLVNEQGLEPAVAAHFVTQQFDTQGIPRNALPDGATTSQFDKPVLGSDRRLYAMASERANEGQGDPTPLKTFDADYRAYNQYKGIIGEAFNNHVDRVATDGGYSRPYAQHLVTQQFLNADLPSHLLPEGADVLNFNNPPDGSDRRLYAMAADGANDPTILENFDRYRDAYGDHKNVITQNYDDRVSVLMTEKGYDRPVAEDLVALELKLSGMPAHLLPEQAKSSNFATPLDGSDRRFNPAAFDEDLAARNQLRGAIDTTFAEPLQSRIEQIMDERSVTIEVAEHLAGMEFGAALRANGVPQQALPAGLAITPTQVLIDKHDTFDKAHDDTSGLEGDGQGWSFGRAWEAAYDVRNNFLGLDDPDGKVGLADLDAVISNPDKFDSDVVAAAMVLREAADDPRNAELRSYFDQPGFWENLKESPWNDPNSDSFVVNLVRGPTGGGYSPAFIQRVITEGPDVLRKMDDSLHQLSPQGQAETLLTDPGQAFDNYVSFLGGAKDFVVDTGKLVGGAVAFSNPVLAAALHRTAGTNVYAEAAGMATGAGNALVFDPDQLAKDIVGWDQFVDDPFRWAGNQAPDIVLEILGTKGASKAARGLRAADTTGDAAQAGRRVLPRSQELIDGFDAQLLRSDVVDGATINHLKLQDGTFVKVTETIDGGFKLSYPDGPPAPRAEDFIADAPPPRAEDFRSSAPPPARPEDAILLNDELGVVNTNPFKASEPERLINCWKCAEAADAWITGSPASALPGQVTSADWERASKYFDYVGDSPQAIVDQLTDAGDGSRVIIYGAYNDSDITGLAHAFNAHNDGGVVRFVDGQTRTSTTSPDLDYDYYWTFRTDNVSQLPWKLEQPDIAQRWSDVTTPNAPTDIDTGRGTSSDRPAGTDGQDGMHGDFREATRGDQVWSKDEVIGDPDHVFYQEDGDRWVYSRSNGDGTNTVYVVEDRHYAGGDMPGHVTVMAEITDKQLQSRVDDSRWVTDPASDP